MFKAGDEAIISATGEEVVITRVSNTGLNEFYYRHMPYAIGIALDVELVPIPKLEPREAAVKAFSYSELVQQKKEQPHTHKRVTYDSGMPGSRRYDYCYDCGKEL